MTDEELIARLRKYKDDLLSITADRIEELLAERKKAVDAFVDLAIATLAELKGENQNGQ